MTEFSLVSPSGDVIPLHRSAARRGDFALLEGTAGLGLVSRDVKIATSSRDGGRLRSVRVAPREGTLVVLVHGADEAERAANLRRLGAAVRNVIGLPMPRLRGTLDTGEVYELPFVFEAGGSNLAPRLGDASYEVPLSVVFPDPFWTSTTALTITVEAAATGDGLLPDLAALRVTPSNAAGSLEVNNPGDVASPAVWRIVGPTSGVTASCRGRGWALGALAAGEVVTIDTKRNTVTLADGTNVYDRLGSAPKLFAIPAGSSTVDITLSDATPGVSRVDAFYSPRMEVVL